MDSIRYIFKNQKQVSEQERSIELAEQIFKQIAQAGKALSRTEISGENNNHLTKKQLDSAIETLLTSIPPRIIATKVKTNGPSKTFYSCAK